MVLVKLAQAVQVLLQLRLVESAGFINKGDDGFALGFHLLAQPPVAEVRVPLETNLFHRAFRSFVHSENHPRRPTLLINWFHTELHADIREAVGLINFDDFFAPFFQVLFSDRVVEFQFDFFAQFLRADPSGSFDYDFSRIQMRLHLDDYLDAVAFWRTEDAKILDRAALVKRFHILLHGYVVIWLAHLCPHICQKPLFTHGGGPCVLYFDRPDDGTRRRLLGSLRPGRWRSQ